MRRFLVRTQPSFQRILLIESGPREIAEQVLQYLYGAKAPSQLDVLTCYDRPPESFDFGRGVVYSVHDREVVENRGRFIRKLSSAPYTLLAVMCTGSSILEKWKWLIAARTKARLVVFNESVRYFGLDIWNIRSAEEMIFHRLGRRLAGFSVGLLIAPFTLAYLVASTLWIHFRRWLRVRRQTSAI